MLAAVRADAADQKIVSGHLEAVRKLEVRGEPTTGHIKEPSTVVALKVMVMMLPARFVSGRTSADRNDLQPTLADEQVDIAIHRSDADSILNHFGFRKQLCGGQGSRFVKEYLPDRLALSRVDGRQPSLGPLFRNRWPT